MASIEISPSSHDQLEECPADVLRICGEAGSPYTQKVLAACRYRRIPHRYVSGVARERLRRELPKPPVHLLPTCFFGDEPMVDSTPILRRLEGLHAGRSLIHPNPGMAFLADLIEDFGDEMVTKCMYQYRWESAEDARKGCMWVVLMMNPAMPQSGLEEMSAFARERQVGRLEFVGSNPTTKLAIEATFLRLVTAMDAHLAAGYFFLFGQRPSTADFALFGQLTQLHRVENTSRRLLEDRSIRLAAWISVMSDLSGRPVCEGDWIPATDEIPLTLRGILEVVGELYAPFMLANADAVARKQKVVSAKLGPHGVQWDQPSFPYQAKCFKWLNEDYQKLSLASRSVVNAALAGTGCEHMFGTAPTGANSSRL